MRNEPQQSREATQAGTPAEVRAVPRPWWLRRRWGRGTAGTTLIEFAFVAPLFLLLMFAIMDFSHLFYEQVVLQNALRQAGRFAMTGNHMPDPQHPGQYLSRVASITAVAQQAAVGLSVSGIQISSLGGGSGSAGGPGDTVTISLTTNLPLMTSLVAQFFNHGTFTFTVSAMFRNESFNPNQIN